MVAILNNHAIYHETDHVIGKCPYCGAEKFAPCSDGLAFHMQKKQDRVWSVHLYESLVTIVMAIVTAKIIP